MAHAGPTSPVEQGQYLPPALPSCSSAPCALAEGAPAWRRLPAYVVCQFTPPLSGEELDGLLV
jgi:hypothetical protein